MTSDPNNTEIQPAGKHAAKNDTGSSEKKRRKRETTKQHYPLSKTGLLALFFVLLVGAGAGYEYFLLQLQAKQDSNLQASQLALNSRIDTLEQELQSTHTLLEEADKALKSELDTVAETLGRTTLAWRLAEIEYLLTVANHRVILVQDYKTAIAAFQTADQRLSAIEDPGLTSIRKEIANELSLLRSMTEPDLTGMAISLESVANEVEKFPLLFKERVDQATGLKQKARPESWRDMPSAVWEEIKGLVVVRKHQQPSEPLLPPEEAWFLKQNLRLKLEQAQLALLRKDTNLFRSKLENAHKWIQTFFDQDSTAVKNALNLLENLTSVELQLDIPDVSGSLRELRSVMAQRR